MVRSSKPSSSRSSSTSRRPPAEPRLSRGRKPEQMSAEAWQAGLRRQFGREQPFDLEPLDIETTTGWEFAVDNAQSATRYRVAIRSARAGENFCSCPDFATNDLGTCKHVEFVLARLSARRGGKAALERGFRPPFSEIHLRYGRSKTSFERGLAAAPGRQRASTRSTMLAVPRSLVREIGAGAEILACAGAADGDAITGRHPQRAEQELLSCPDFAMAISAPASTPNSCWPGCRPGAAARPRSNEAFDRRSARSISATARLASCAFELVPSVRRRWPEKALRCSATMRIRPRDWTSSFARPARRVTKCASTRTRARSSRSNAMPGSDAKCWPGSSRKARKAPRCASCSRFRSIRIRPRVRCSLLERVAR